MIENSISPAADLNKTALTLFRAGIDRADPALALRQSLLLDPLPALPENGKYFVLAIGKAAVPMIREALAHISQPFEAMAVTNAENRQDIDNVDLWIGSHPVPDEASAAAGAAVMEFAGRAGANDRVIALISGGGSALAVAPSAGLTLADKTEVNRLLLGGGVEISQMNLVRQQLSDIKGGGLLRQAAPAQVFSYILSDVIGDDLRAIASGPTVAAIADRASARETLLRADLWEDTPSAVRTHLDQAAPTNALRPTAHNKLIGSNRYSLDAVAAAAKTDWNVSVVSDALVGDVRDAARQIVQAAREASTHKPVALLWGGETTVQLRGSGRGGRNQELALRVAEMGANLLSGDWVFLSGGTDGRDGPTDAAGGIVTARTWQKIIDSGHDAQALLANNDSFAALAAADALIKIGGTGTNVADLQIFLRRPS